MALRQKPEARNPSGSRWVAAGPPWIALLALVAMAVGVGCANRRPVEPPEFSGTQAERITALKAAISSDRDQLRRRVTQPKGDDDTPPIGDSELRIIAWRLTTFERRLQALQARALAEDDP